MVGDTDITDLRAVSRAKQAVIANVAVGGDIADGKPVAFKNGGEGIVNTVGSVVLLIPADRVPAAGGGVEVDVVVVVCIQRITAVDVARPSAVSVRVKIQIRHQLITA